MTQNVDSNRPVVIDRHPDRAPLSAKGRRRYEDLVRGAARVFRDKGYESATIQDIASAAGLRTGTIYHYVSSKEDLLFAVIETFHAGTDRIIKDLEADADLSVVERLEVFIRRHVVELTANSDSGAVFSKDFRSLTGEHRAEVIRKRREYEGFLRDVLAEGLNDDSFREHSVELTAKAILGMLNDMVVWYRSDGPNTPTEIGDEYVRLVMTGLAP